MGMMDFRKILAGVISGILLSSPIPVGIISANPGVTYHEELDLDVIFRTTSGGTVFSSNLAGQTVFDYFDDAAQVNDAIYFGKFTSYYYYWEDLKLFIGTAFAATSVTSVWEFRHKDGTWHTLTVVDNTNSFTNLGECRVMFEGPGGYGGGGWVGYNVNGSTRLWVRCRITAVDTPTEGGANSTQKAKCYWPRIRIVGGSNSFTSLHAADLAGTFLLLGGYIDANPDTFSLGHPISSCEQAAMKLSISCTARVGATCNISGTDIEDSAISETGIDISSGSVTTTKYFASIDTDGITVNGLQNGDDFDISQPRWGVIWKTGEGDQFQIDRRVYVGDGSTATVFSDNSKEIRWMPRTQAHFMVEENATLTLGILEDLAGKVTSKGCTILTTPLSPYGGITTGDGTIYLYGCTFMDVGGYRSGISSDRLWGCTLSNYVDVGIVSDLYDTKIIKGQYGTSYQAISIDGAFIAECSTSAHYLYSAYHPIITNCVYLNNTYLLRAYHLKVDQHIINPDYDNWTISWAGTDYGKKIYEQYTMNIKILDRDKNVVVDATVELKDKDGNVVFSLTTDVNGQIAEQTVTKATYKMVDGDTPTLMTPHSIEISKTESGLLTYEGEFDLEQKIDWIIMLASAADARYAEDWNKASLLASLEAFITFGNETGQDEGGATNTMVRCAVGRLPEDRTDGYLVYYGEGTSCSDTAVSLDETAVPIYYRAWSQSIGGLWENEGVSDFIEGGGMTTVAIIVLVLGLTALAYAVKSGMLYAACIPAWMFFTFYMFNINWTGNNTYLPTAIAIFGAAMTIIVVATTAMHYMGNQSSEPTYDEEKASNTAKIYKLTHKKNPWED